MLVPKRRRVDRTVPVFFSDITGDEREYLLALLTES